ncbi:Crp/Fnr family transcriptional regulator [Wenzhouxiangella sediminis]|jgi:CRP-like cAMP-binding protein|uniref:Crp/Fnr family transcriptional regulator n=1 Tax=Wenzhouxiangella sediminis TaxID=1792836 RepID=A0A3E1KAW6_9GAMM|nr:Crp/Fnr family transcriptional regulator [Wenzhouxiangella sediminis]RFF31589.1 Crp/Fnr family transcriptional regulator [Wenzhouxiangella sediminis]
MERAVDTQPLGLGRRTSETVSENRMLDCLSPDELSQLMAVSDLTSFVADARIAVGGDVIREIYFPVSGYASLMITGSEESSVQVAFAGREGILGWESLLGRESFLLDIYVPEALKALRVDVGEFLIRAAANEHWRNVQFKYVAGLFTVVARGVLCARFHVLEARLARCLLEVSDRHAEIPILLTQNTLAKLLGVRRSGVTNAATHLQLLGLIQYRRGEIRLLDRKGLEAAACECYRFDVH